MASAMTPDSTLDGNDPPPTTHPQSPDAANNPPTSNDTPPTSNDTPPSSKPPAPPRLHAGGITRQGAARLKEALQSDTRVPDRDTRALIRTAFYPMAMAAVNSAKSEIPMSDDDNYKILNRCKIGSAVMLPYILNPQWKVR